MTADFIRGGLLGMTAMLLVTLIYAMLAENAEEKVAQAAEIIAAYKQGKKDALKTNPVNWELEQTCLGLWTERQ
jgi:uncharacterized protein (DUF1501 family)